MSFFTILTVVKILAKFGTTRKMLNAVGLFFEFLRIVWGFLLCLSTWTCVKLSLLQVRVLTIWSSLQLIFTELLKLFFKVLTIIFRIHAYGHVWRTQLAGRKGEGGGGGWGLPYSFLKIEKIVLIIWKNALIVFIHKLNVHLCSKLKCHFKST